jgi:hypothetical protein
MENAFLKKFFSKIFGFWQDVDEREQSHKMDTRRKTIPGFDHYTIDTFGAVRNAEGRVLTIQMNQQGTVYVSLYRGNGKYSTRAISKLVAEAFIRKPHPSFDTPINLNGDRTDNQVLNLAWRPRWFAFRYHRQFENPINQPPVMDVRTNIVFPSPHEAAMQFGLIAAEIYTQAWNYSSRAETRETVWPTRQQFCVLT